MLTKTAEKSETRIGLAPHPPPKLRKPTKAYGNMNLKPTKSQLLCCFGVQKTTTVTTVTEIQ